MRQPFLRHHTEYALERHLPRLEELEGKSPDHVFKVLRKCSAYAKKVKRQKRLHGPKWA